MAETLQELKQKNLPRCTAADAGFSVLRGDSAEAAEFMATLDKYFSAFAKPIASDTSGAVSSLFGNSLCLKCGEPLGGVLGTFRWGLVNGEGNCASCGWPARALHRPRNDDGTEIFHQPISVILQYHPEYVEQSLENDEGEL